MTSNITKNFKAKSALRKEHGGDVKGPGGPTEDKVGPVMLSDGEYVLPADTVDAVGVDNLDALRDATHDFEDTDGGGRPKIPGRLRGMAAGGVFYVDPEGNAARATQPGRAMVPAKPQLPVTQTAPPRAAPAAEPLRAQVLNSTPAAPSRMSQLRAAANTGGGRLGNFARGMAPVQMTAGALSTLGDQSSGYRDEYNKQLGIAPDAGVGKQVLGDTARVMESVGDSLTFGLAGRLGRGLGNLAAGESFMEGFTGPSERERFAARQAAPAAAAPAARSPLQSATPVADTLGPSAMANESNRRTGGAVDGRFPGALENRSGLANSDPRINGSTSAAYNAMGDNDVVGSFNGRSVTKKEADARAAGLQTASFMPQRPQGDPLMDEIRSALRGSGGSRGGGAVISGQGSVDDINKRYDDMLRNGAGQNRVRGLDWSQRHGLDVERARANELGEFARNQSTLRGQDIAASNAADQNRTQLANTLLGIQAQREKAALDARSAMTKAQFDAQKAAIEQNQQGYENFMGQLGNMFPGADGKPDAASQQAFLDFVSATDPKVLQERTGVSSVKDLFSLTPQEQLNAVQSLKAMKDMQDARNAAVQDGPFNNGMQMTGFDAPVGEARDAGFSDIFNRNLSLKDYVYSNLPFTDNRVQQLESGVVVPYDEYVGNSADREKARKSNLRNP